MVASGSDWERAYELQHTPWDLGGVTPPLQALAAGGFFTRLELPEHPRVAAPGCGRGHDLRVFAELGHRVTGFDIARSVVAEAQALLDRDRAGGDAQVLCRDVLALVPIKTSSTGTSSHWLRGSSALTGAVTCQDVIIELSAKALKISTSSGLEISCKQE